jgi:hypothetical protein
MGCDPGESLVNWIYPTEIGKDETHSSYTLNFNGRGTTLQNFYGALKYLSARQKLPIYFPVALDQADAGSLTQVSPSAVLLRTRISVTGSTDSSSTADFNSEFLLDVDEWIRTDVYPILKNLEFGKEKNVTGRVYFTDSGGVLDEAQQTDALINDMILAGCSFLVIWICIAIQLKGAFLLAGCSCLLIGSALPLAYALFRLMSGQEEFSIINCVSFFFVFGIGADNIFVFTDAYNQAYRSVLANDITKPWVPLAAAFSRALKASSTVMFATTASFIVNALPVNPIPAVRDFGIYMSLCIMFLLCQTVLYWLPALLVFDRATAEFLDSERGEKFVRCCGRSKPGRVLFLSSFDQERVKEILDEAMELEEEEDLSGSLKPKVDENQLGIVERFVYGRFAHFVFTFRYGITCTYGLQLLISSIWLGNVFEFSFSAPDLFRDEHNLVKVQTLLEEFADPNQMADPEFHRVRQGRRRIYAVWME